MEDHLKQGDEITLAGVTRQDNQLCGNTDMTREGLLKALFSGLRDMVSRVFGGGSGQRGDRKWSFISCRRPSPADGPVRVTVLYRVRQVQELDSNV